MRTCDARTRAQHARGPRRYAPWLLAVIVAAGCDVPTALPRFENTLALPAPDIQVPVLGIPAQTAPVRVDLGQVDEGLADRTRGGQIEFTPVNPENGTGTLEVTIVDAESGTTVSQTITITAEGTPQVVTVTGQEMREFLGGDVEITLAGALGPAVLPPRTVALEAIVRLMFEIGGEG